MLSTKPNRNTNTTLLEWRKESIKMKWKGRWIGVGETRWDEDDERTRTTWSNINGTRKINRSCASRVVRMPAKIIICRNGIALHTYIYLGNVFQSWIHPSSCVWSNQIQLPRNQHQHHFPISHRSTSSKKNPSPEERKGKERMDGGDSLFGLFVCTSFDPILWNKSWTQVTNVIHKRFAAL